MTQTITRWGMLTALTNPDAEEKHTFVSASFAAIIEEIERYTQNGSGWVVNAVEALELHIDRYRPGRSRAITLPRAM